MTPIAPEDLIAFTTVAAVLVPAIVEVLKQRFWLPTDAAGGAAVIVGILLAFGLTHQLDPVTIFTGAMWGGVGTGVYSQVKHFFGDKPDLEAEPIDTSIEAIRADDPALAAPRTRRQAAASPHSADETPTAN